jgi:transketolase
MRDAFFRALLEEARRDARVILVNPDTAGFYCDAYRSEIPEQYVNAGIAEQNAVGISAGLALVGRRPFIFNILAFNSFRCFEQVRLDVCAMNLSVVLAGVGAGLDYGIFGPSHHAMEDVAVMRSLPGMAVWSPADETVAAALVPHCLQAGGPAYLRLSRAGQPRVYSSEAVPDLNEGVAELRPGRDLLLAATGPLVVRALEVAGALSGALDVGVVDVFRLKPFPERRFLELAASYPCIATLEEHVVSGGLGTAVLEALADHGISKKVRRFGLPDQFCRICGDRDYLHGKSGLDAATLVARLRNGSTGQ